MSRELVHRPAPLRKPSGYSSELADEVLRQMCDGQLLKVICDNPFMPSHTTVRMWAVTDEAGFSMKFDAAVEMQSHAWFEKAIEIGTAEDEFNLRNVTRDRMAVDTLMKAAGKTNARTYGDKIDDKGGIIVNINTSLGDGKSDMSCIDKGYVIDVPGENLKKG